MIPITTIKEQFKKVIQYSQGIQNPQVDELFDRWLEAKRDIIETWGGECIVEVPHTVSFELSEQEKRHRLNEFIDAVDNMYGNNELVQFLDWLTIDEVFKNHLEREYWLNSSNKISKGTKIIKAFKHFETDEKVLRDIQDRLSMIIQEDKVSGTLCFSVHPLDFLSSSENTYHWRSCHALDGEYRSGNLSYMMDKSTIICYLRKQGEIEKLPNFPEEVRWNSKKWRMLLFLSDDWNAMFAGRQYPFFSPTALDIVQMNLLSLLGKNTRFWSPWYNDVMEEFPRKNSQDCNYSDVYLRDRVVMLSGKLYKMQDLVHDCSHPLHFNDLLNSSYYIPYYSWNRQKSSNLIFNIGGEIPCPCCNGKNRLVHSDSMMCDPCELTFGEGENEYFAYCGCCECRCTRDDMYYISGLDDLVCPTCFERETRACDCCRRSWYSTDIVYHSEKKQYLCPECYMRTTTGASLNDISLDLYIPWDDDLPF